MCFGSFSASSSHSFVCSCHTTPLACPQLHDCLSMFAEKEKLEDIEGYKCENCKKQTGAWKKLSVYKPPSVLILRLKRFSGGGLARFSRFSKNSARVSVDTGVRREQLVKMFFSSLAHVVGPYDLDGAFSG